MKYVLLLALAVALAMAATRSLCYVNPPRKS